MTPTCYLGGEPHSCVCVVKGGTTIHACGACTERGCPERRRRAHYAATIPKSVLSSLVKHRGAR